MKYSNDGLPIRIKIPRKDSEIAAIAWSEGRESLKKLLQYCIKSKICTMACCAGHKEICTYESTGEQYEGYSSAYISFSLNNQATKDCIVPLFSELIGCNVIGCVTFAAYQENGTIDCSVYINQPLEDVGFEAILSVLQRIKEGEKIETNTMVKTVYDTITGIDRQKIESFYVEYRKDLEAGKFRMTEGTKNRELDYDNLSEEKIIETMQEIQKDKNIFKGNNRKLLDNIYQFCIDQKAIMYSELLNKKWKKKQEKEKTHKGNEYT